MGGKGALNYLPIVPKASIYVPKVMPKPVMGGNTITIVDHSMKVRASLTPSLTPLPLTSPSPQRW